MEGHCPRCGIGIDDDHDGDCRYCSKLSDIDAAFQRWWFEIARRGDPIRRPNLAREGFNAGWEARERLPGKAMTMIGKRHVIYSHYKTRSRDGKREPEYSVLIDFQALHDMARKAFENKGREAIDGPLQVVITEAPLYDPEPVKL